jgi:hypothetical protein
VAPPAAGAGGCFCWQKERGLAGRADPQSITRNYCDAGATSLAGVANGGWHVADGREIEGRRDGPFLLLVITAIALGILGIAVKGLFYLLIIGVILFAADLVFLAPGLAEGAGAQAGEASGHKPRIPDSQGRDTASAPNG